MNVDYEIERSRATEPLFFTAPHPEQMEPHQYQLAGVEYAVARDHCLFGDAPGLGKTAECIMLGNAIEAKRTLVVCPASLRLNWEREIWAWSTIPNVTTYPILKSKDGVSHEHHYVIISYSLLSNPSILNALMAVTWDHLILDEAHALKDPHGNKRTQVLCAPDLIPSVVGRITMASGTILPNQPIECYNAIRLLDWSAIDEMSLHAFRQEFYTMGEGFITVRGKSQWSDKVRNVPRNLDDLQRRLRSHVMVRRLKDQVLHELPPVQWNLFPLALTAGIKRALKHPGWTEVEKLYEMDEDMFDGAAPIDGQISTARRELGEAAAPAIADYIEDLLESGLGKVVVGAWHHSVLDILRERLTKHGLVYMDGSTSAAKKQTAVDEFQGNADIKLILGQLMPLGEGWTLTAAQDCVIAEPDWVPGKNEQFVDRINRMGQEGDYTLAHVPVVPNTLSERILSRAIGKAQNIYKALDHQE